MYKLKKVIYKNSPISLIIRNQDLLPCVLPLIYSSLQLRKKAYNTQISNMVSIKLWYEYWQKKFDFCFDYQVLLSNSKYDLLVVIEELNNFWLYLEESKFLRAMNNETRSKHIYSLSSFLKFLGSRFINLKYMPELSNDRIRQQLTHFHWKLKSVVESTTQKASHYSSSNAIYKSLPDDFISCLQSTIIPSTKNVINTLNPWYRPCSQLRNYIIIKMLLEYGLRLGELLSLTTSSIKPNLSGKGYSLIITTDSSQVDTRVKPASIKNSSSHRSLYLTEIDYKLLELYIATQRGLLEHTFIFVADRTSVPLSGKQVSNILKELEESIYKQDPTYSKIHITPHSLRHTWATKLLKYFIENEENDMELALDKLRNLGGWAINSSVPNYYAYRYIHTKANEANLTRIKSVR